MGLDTLPLEQNQTRKKEWDHKNNHISQKTRLGYSSDSGVHVPKASRVKVLVISLWY